MNEGARSRSTGNRANTARLLIHLAKSSSACCRRSRWKWPRPAISRPPWKSCFAAFARRRAGCSDRPGCRTKDGSALDCDSVWFCGEGDLQDFRRASEAIHFKRGVGLPGRVWESKQSAWVEDVTNDPNFPRSGAARTAGLKTGVANPDPFPR